MAAKQDLFNLGVEMMDGEHRALAELFEEFASCIRVAPANADEIVQRAITLANAHFAHEEELIDRSAYPHAEEHKFQHRNLRLRLTTLVGDSVALKSCDPLTLDNLDMMRALLEEHIDGPDRALAAHLKSAMVK